MTIRQSLLAQAALGIAAGLYSLSVARSLPDKVPTHWGISGKPDAWGSPAFALWFGPCMVVVLMFMTWGLPKISPRQFAIDRFSESYSTIMLMVTALMAVIHFIILRATAGLDIQLNLWMMVVLGVFFSVLGNMMGKVRRNFFMGVRTPWTLASERVWEATHRKTGRIWFFGGIAIALLALVGAPLGIQIGIMIVMSIWPILLSYILYRKLENP